MKKASVLLLIVFAFAQGTLAQPPNDFCSGAFATNADGTCYGPGLPQTTTVGAGDDWVGTLGCAGNNGEVWFSFVATTSQLDINISSGTIGGNLEFVLVQSLTPPCGGLTLGGGGGTACGGSPLTATFNGLQIGSTYYYTISSTGSDGTFTSCLTSTVPTPVAGQDCSAAAILCDASGFSQGTSAAGFGTQEVTTGNSCWGSGGERQSKWFKFTIGCSGTLEFNINPVISGDDYDWGLWDVTSDITCGSKGNTIACNWSGCKGSTGITTCANAIGEPGRVSSGAGCFGGPAAWNITTLNVTAGNTYALLVDNFSTSNSGFSLSFGGACGGGTAVIGPDANFTGSLDATCMAYTSTKTCPTANSTYLWTYGDGSTSTGMNGSHTYATTGNYTVTLTVTDALGCVSTYSETVNVGCILPIELTNFSAELMSDEFVKVDWTTISELNNDFFTLERSDNGITFESIATIDGAGNSTSELNYQFVDRKAINGSAYYRLKQTDYDGQSELSNVIGVNGMSSFGEISIQPNPIKGNGTLSFVSNAIDNVEVSIVDLTGKEVMRTHFSTKVGENNIMLETSAMIKGMYFLILTDSIESTTVRFIKE